MCYVPSIAVFVVIIIIIIIIHNFFVICTTSRPFHLTLHVLLSIFKAFSPVSRNIKLSFSRKAYALFITPLRSAVFISIEVAAL